MIALGIIGAALIWVAATVSDQRALTRKTQTMPQEDPTLMADAEAVVKEALARQKAAQAARTAQADAATLVW